MSALIVAALAVLAALLFGRAWGAFAALQHGKYCSLCGRRALPLTHRKYLRLFSRVVERRWCPACGWEGLRRRRYRVPAPAGFEAASRSRRVDPRSEDRPLLWNDRDTGREDAAG